MIPNAPSAIKMDELLVKWLASDSVFENVETLIKKFAKPPPPSSSSSTASSSSPTGDHDASSSVGANNDGSDSASNADGSDSGTSNTNTNNNAAANNNNNKSIIPPLFGTTKRWKRNRRSSRSKNNNTNNNAAAAAGAGDASNNTSTTVDDALSASSHDSSSLSSNSSLDGSTNSAGMDGSGGGGGGGGGVDGENNNNNTSSSDDQQEMTEDMLEDEFVWEGPKKQMAQAIYEEIATGANNASASSPDDENDDANVAGNGDGAKQMTLQQFGRITKDVLKFPSFFNGPLWNRILFLWNRKEENQSKAPASFVSWDMLEWFVKTVLEDCSDAAERYFRLMKQPNTDFIGRDDFLPYMKELLNDHPGLEFLSTHAEFQEKYAVTVITRIFYSVNRCHSGRITLRQVRRSDLLEAFLTVDAEEDINKVKRYFSYEHFYVLYCRFWELDHDRDYRITRDDLLKYGDHSLSHMIVDRIFDAAPRPFASSSTATNLDGTPQQDPNAPDDGNNNGNNNNNKEFLSYEDFIFFMLSEEDKSNEVSVRYWFQCVDVDGDGCLNNMEMRSFYAVQLHRMQLMNHEIVPFEDMLCQMMDMVKPKHPEHLVPEDFLQPECAQVSGALFDALFNLNKYLMFEQRDPFVERQKREDEFETDWDRFAYMDYNRLAMEEEAREEEAMEIDWVTVDEEDEVGGDALIQGDDDLAGMAQMGGAGGGMDPGGANTVGSSEAPF